ncbi:hypothetical protein KFE25_004087 [Diacronema lutheri]|uniref:Cytochrome P450 n=1 Tax=Diacronema lutheri TaxID=2081491 RepID=A0A8J5XFX7_DIALT|nr:hypothetical protein KFE25_004087 [Diacronema lutheri]
MLTPALVRQTTSLWTFAKLALAWIIGILLAPLTLPFVLVWYVLAPFVLSTQKKNLTTLEARMRALHPLTGGVSEAYWGSLVASMTVPIVGIDQPENAPNTWRYLASLPLLLPVVLVPVAAATFSADLFTYIARSAAAAQFARFPRGAGTVASWRNTFMFPVLLIANAGARVVAYTYELTAFRAGAGMREGLNYWFHGNGLWTGSHDEVDAMLRSSQQRGPVRAGFFLIAPDIFASRILLFLSNIGRDSEWAAVRSQAHKMLFVPSSARLADLERRVRADWSPLAPPTAADLKDATCTVRLVTKCVFYALFGKWLDDADTEVLTGWRTMAATFVMPRATQRLLLNHGVEQLGTLRINSLGVVRKHKLEVFFAEFNEGLGKWRRTHLADLVDEIMFAVGFAGVGGTSAAVASMGSFLAAEQSADGGAHGVDFDGRSAADMHALYAKDPQAFIMEACRLSSPVGTFTTLLPETTPFATLGAVPAGTPVSGVLNMANRDPAVFPNPTRFDPSRAELSKAVTWNGQAFGPNEVSYPRICPGRNLSVAIIKAIVNVALSSEKMAPAP